MNIKLNQTVSWWDREAKQYVIAKVVKIGKTDFYCKDKTGKIHKRDLSKVL